MKAEAAMRLGQTSWLRKTSMVSAMGCLTSVLAIALLATVAFGLAWSANAKHLSSAQRVEQTVH